MISGGSPGGRAPDFERTAPGAGGGGSRSSRRRGGRREGAGRPTKEERERKAAREEAERQAAQGAVVCNELCLHACELIAGRRPDVTREERETLDRSLAEIFLKYDFLMSRYAAEFAFVGTWSAIAFREWRARPRPRAVPSAPEEPRAAEK